MDKKVIEKLNDKNLVRKIINMLTKEDVKKAFADEGIEITEKDLGDLGKMIVNMVSKLSEMSEEELNKISGGRLNGPLLDAFFYLPQTAKAFATAKVGMSDNNADDFVCIPVLAAEFIAVYEGGKYVYKKAREGAWWTKLVQFEMGTHIPEKKKK